MNQGSFFRKLSLLHIEVITEEKFICVSRLHLVNYSGESYKILTLFFIKTVIWNWLMNYFEISNSNVDQNIFWDLRILDYSNADKKKLFGKDLTKFCGTTNQSNRNYTECLVEKPTKIFGIGRINFYFIILENTKSSMFHWYSLVELGNWWIPVRHKTVRNF